MSGPHQSPALDWQNKAIRNAERRFAKAKPNADRWDSMHREVWEYLAPERYSIATGTGNKGQTSNTPIFNEIFDGEPLTLMADGAGQVAEALHPWEQVWMTFKPKASLDENTKKNAAKRGQALTRIVHDLLGGSNFQTEAPTAHQDWLVGTAFLAVDHHPYDDSKIVFKAISPHEMVIDVDAGGNFISAMFRTTKFEVRQLPEEFPKANNWPKEIEDNMERNPQHEVEVRFAFIAKKGPKGPGGKSRLQWHCFAYPTGNHTTDMNPVWEFTYNSSPIICYRCRPRVGMPYGSGPALASLPDVKVLCKLAELNLMNASISVVGIWMAENDGVLNPANVHLTPGSIIPVAPNSKGLQPLQAPGDFRISEFLGDQLLDRVKRRFFIAKVEEREMTATEFQGRSSTLTRDMRADYGQLKAEFSEQLAVRVLDLAAQKGLTNKDDVIDSLLELELTGPLARETGQEEVQRMMQALQTAAGVFGPQIIPIWMKIPETLEFILARTHADRSIFREFDDMADKAAQIEQMAAQVMAQQLAQAAMQFGEQAGQGVGGAMSGIPPQLAEMMGAAPNQGSAPQAMAA